MARAKAVERWSRFRAENFLQAFVESLSEELDTGIEEFQKQFKAADECKDNEREAHWVGDSIAVPCIL